jgi:hypothetical protein
LLPIATIGSSGILRAPPFLICREGPDPRAHNSGRGAGSASAGRNDVVPAPRSVSPLATLFVILLCTGYLYVAFFFFFMFRTILLPEHYAR